MPDVVASQAILQEREPTSTLLDNVLPRYAFRGVVERTACAAPQTIFRALREVTFDEMPLATLLGTARYVPSRLLGRMPVRETSRSFWAETASAPLAEAQDREVVIGTIGRLHDLLDQQFVTFANPDEYQRFQHPDFQKLALSIRTEPGPGLGTTRIIMEHRTLPLGPSGRWKFTLYWWLLIRWASGLMGGLLLDAVQRRAERSSR
jgi:hypothetical protein